MSATPRRVRCLLPLALLLAALSFSCTHATRAATTTVSYSVDALPKHTYYVTGSATSSVSVSLDARSGTATLTPGIVQTVGTNGSVHLSQLYDGADDASGRDTFTRQFTVDGVTHPQVQSAQISAVGDEESDYFAEYLALQAGATVTYDLGATGKLDVTPLAYQYDTGNNMSNAQPPIQYRFLLHDVPGAPDISSVKISPAQVYAGATTYGKVTLTKPAPSGGQVVTLINNAPGAATFPDTVTVRAGTLSVTFPVTTAPVDYTKFASIADSDTPVSVSATAGGKGKAASFTVLARYRVTGSLTSGDIGLYGGKVTAKATGTFVLTSTATPAAAIPDNNATGVVSTLNSGASGTVGGLVVGLDITHPRISDLVVTLQAPDGTTVFLQNKGGGSQKNLQTSYPVLTVPVDSLSAFNGKAADGTWKLTVKDAAGGNVGTLNNWSLTFVYDGTVTTSVTATSSNYLLVLKAGTYSITPTIAGNSFTPASRTVTVGPSASPPNASHINFEGGAAVSRLDIKGDAGTNVVGGSSATGTVTLTKPAPAGGLFVTLSGDNPTFASVPSSVTVAAGQTKATFPVTTSVPTGDQQDVNIFASGGGSKAQLSFIVLPNLLKLSVNHGTVTGGASVTGTAALTGETSQPVTVLLQSSNPAAVSVPSSARVSYNKSSVMFPITTHAVGTSTTVTITATINGAVTKTVHLTVTP